jgi:hypothetical protein
MESSREIRKNKPFKEQFQTYAVTGASAGYGFPMLVAAGWLALFNAMGLGWPVSLTVA